MSSHISDNETQTARTADAQRLQCMSVWGGNASTNRAFQLSGLRIWIHSKPHGNADRGGDVYYLSSCASGRVTRLLLADVSGHGPTVSQAAESLRDSMRLNVNHTSQQRVVEAINQKFTERFSMGRFATAIVSTCFAPSRRLTLSNAGHPPPLVYRKAQNEWSVYEPRVGSGPQSANLPLGVLSETRFDQSDVRLSEGDMVLLHTDAFSEARNDRDEMFGTEGLRTLLQSLSHEAHRNRLPARPGAHDTSAGESG